MNAAVLYREGQRPRFDVFPDPRPAEGEEVVTVRAAALKNIERMMAEGSHYDRHESLPAIVGVDGIAVREDGTRVYCGGCPAPYGMMAERTLIPKGFAFPIPGTLDDATAAALPNPAMSSWLALTWRAKLQPGETVLVLGATGVSGLLAVQIARHLGASRVVAAGRDAARLARAEALGADAVVRLDGSPGDLRAAFAREHAHRPFDVVLDYLWGPPAEALLAAVTGDDLGAEGRPLRYVEIGEAAGADVRLSAAALRSSGLELYGSGGGSVPHEVIFEAIPRIFELAATGQLRVETEVVPLAEISAAWERETPGRRIVVVP